MILLYVHNYVDYLQDGFNTHVCNSIWFCQFDHCIYPYLLKFLATCFVLINYVKYIHIV